MESAIITLSGLQRAGLLSYREWYMLTLSVAHKQMIAQDTPEASQFLLSVDTNSGGGEPYGYTMLLLDVADSVLSALAASTPQASAATPTPTAHLLTLASTLQAAAFRLVSSRLEHIYGFVSENDVKMASRQERSVRGLLQDPALTYGEVSAGPFLVALREARAGCHSLPGTFTTTTTTTTTTSAATAAPNPPPISGCMVDAGSGAGRGLMVAALAADFAVCRGIELLEGLHMIACEAGRRYGVLTHCDAQRHALLLQTIHSHQQHISSRSTSSSISRHRGGGGGNNLGVLLLTLPPTPPPPAVMVLHLGSFLDPTPTGGGAPCIIGGSPGASDHPPWPLAADVLFANSTCYPEEPHLRRLGVLMGEFAREGSVAITLTRPLSPFHPHLAPLGATKVHFSWGEATLFLHRVGRGASGAGGGGGGGGGGANSTSSIRRGGSPSTKGGVVAASAPSRFNRDLDYISSMAHHGEAGAAAAASALAAAVQAMQSKSPPSVLDGWAMTAPPHPISQHPPPSRGGDATFEEEGEEEEEEEEGEGEGEEEEGEEDEYYVEEEEEETEEEESVQSSVGVQQLPTPRPSSVMALLSEMYVAARQEVAEQRREEGLPSLPSTTLSDRGSVVSNSQASSSVYEHQPSRLQRSPSSQHTKHQQQQQQQQQEQEQEQQARNDELSLIGAMATHLLGSGKKKSKSPSPTRSPPPSHSKYSHSPSAATGATAAAAAGRQSSPPLPSTPSSPTPLPAAPTPPPSHTRLVSIRHGWAAEVALRDLAEGRGWGGGVEDAIWPGDPFMHTTTTPSGDQGSLSIRVEQHSQRRSSGGGTTISSPQGASLQERKWRRTQEISSPQGASLQDRKWRKSQGQWDDGDEDGEGGEGDDGEESVSGLREAVAMGFDDEAAGMNSTHSSSNSSSSRRSDMDMSGVSRRGGGGAGAGASLSHIHATLISSPQGATLQEIKWRRRAEAMTEGGGGAGVYDLGDEGEDTGDEGSAGNTTLGGGSEDSSWPAQLIPGQRDVLVGASK